MFETLPNSYEAVKDWEWEQFAPYLENLLARDLNAETAEAWLTDQSNFNKLVWEVYTRLSVANSQDTTDEDIEKRYYHFIEALMPPATAAANEISKKIVASGIKPADFEVPLKKMQAELEIFRDENLPILSELRKLGTEYDKISGAQTIKWEGEEITIAKSRPILQDPDRAKREKVWRAASERQLQDREAINELWRKGHPLRQQVAHNAGLSDYRAYVWKEYARFDYDPADCQTFHNAIESEVVPAMERIYEKRRQRLGLDTLRPWDLSVDATGLPPLRPYEKTDDLINIGSRMFHQVDAELGKQFDYMRDNGLLDLENRKGKAPGGYNTAYPISEDPFIFMNAVGLHDDVQTLLHEAGHAFHVFAVHHHPYIQQKFSGIEFAEVASMSMELLAAPYLSQAKGGYYATEAEPARARLEHLEGLIKFWPYMAVVDAFQHWAYTHPDGGDPAACDAHWGELWGRFMRGVDDSGLEDNRVTGWQRKLHIFNYPFYYVEYGIAQLGAVQVWANALKDQAASLAAYRKALSLGGTAPLPTLFETAGAKLALDAATLRQAVTLIESTIEELEAAL